MSDGCEIMAKHWSVASLVALALLGYLVGTRIDAAPQLDLSPRANPVQRWNPNPGANLPSPPRLPPMIPARWILPNPPPSWYPPNIPTVGNIWNILGSRNPPGPIFYDPSQSSSTQKPPTNSYVSRPPPNQNPQYPKEQAQIPKSTPPPRKKPQTSADQSSHVQQPPQVLPISPLPVESCAVEESIRVPCGRPGISTSDCKEMNCCHDGQQCYFGKAVTVQCTMDGQFIVVVSRDATLPRIYTETIILMGSGPGCTSVDSNSAFAIYQFPVTACGSMVKEETGAIVYENSMISSYQVELGPRGAITRDSHYQLMFQCRYIHTSVEAVVVEVLRLDNPAWPVAGTGPFNVALKLGNGQCHIQGCDELSMAYSSYYTEADYPLAKVLREPVYVDVHIVDKKNSLYVLTLDRCWATTSPNPHTMPQWDIIIDGCPYRVDNYMTELVPVPTNMDFATHHRRFLFKMFTFVDSNSQTPPQQTLFIHCTAAVCLPAPNRHCEHNCMSRRKRDVSDGEQKTDGPKTVVSSGQLVYSVAEE